MKTKRKPVALFCMFILIVPLLAGCWDRLEIEERAVVLGISIDTASPGEESQEQEVSHLRGKYPVPTRELIRVAVQIALPGKIPLGPGGGEGEEGGEGGGAPGAGQTVWIIDVVGHTIDDALMNLQQQISSRLFYGHLRVIVVSEEMGRRGLENINDFLRRNSEVRRTAWMLISGGKAIDLMKATPQLKRIPTLYLLATLDDAVKLGKFPNDFVGIFWSNSSKHGQEAFLPYVKLMKEQNIEIYGLAYFRNDKMVGVTKPFEIAGYMGIKGIRTSGYRGFVRADGPEKTVTVYATSRKSKMNVEIRNGKPHFIVSVMTEIDVEEKLSESFQIGHSDVLKEIEKENKKGLIKTYGDLIRKTQEKGSDIFGFGEYIRAKKPLYWNEHVRTKERWQETYKNATFEIRVTTRVRRIGMKAT
ncbi:Spore germination protein A3 [Paenibacillus sp. CECT 9249]|nr:Ger(x)C family spore germination protein [Paenibacillus sp. CECT 9249]MBU5442961.1 Ger(x)C family spore germination protein [Paenibacillus sp. MSJ-34]CAH0119491.1 Spore germination protein A3 [Paenibacillus sp. CECT 9249]